MNGIGNRVNPASKSPGCAVYFISVAARLTQMHPNTLRKYDRAGLVSPSRTIGQQRIYSEQDLERLTHVKVLVENYGLGIEGIKLILDILNRLETVLVTLEKNIDIPIAGAVRSVDHELRSIVNKFLP